VFLAHRLDTVSASVLQHAWFVSLWLARQPFQGQEAVMTYCHSTLPVRQPLLRLARQSSSAASAQVLGRLLWRDQMPGSRLLVPVQVASLQPSCVTWSF
jgi:hypothetical protein